MVFLIIRNKINLDFEDLYCTCFEFYKKNKCDHIKEYALNNKFLNKFKFNLIKVKILGRPKKISKQNK